MPPQGAICVLYEGENHYQYLRLKPNHADKMKILTNKAKLMGKRYREKKKSEGKSKKKTKKSRKDVSKKSK